MKQTYSATDTDRQLIELHRLSSKLIKEHPEILIIRADKGSITVAMERNTYNEKINDLFYEKDTYTEIKKNPICTQ